MRTTREQRRMLDYLAEREVDPEYALKAGLFPVTKEEAMRFPYAASSEGGICIPYFAPLTGDIHPTLMRIRYLGKLPRYKDDESGKWKEARYMQTKGSPLEAYFDKNVDWKKVRRDPRITVHIVEGEIKALKMNQEGYTTIALGGVDSYGGEDLTEWLRTVLVK